MHSVDDTPLHVQSVFYANPDHYPPMINSAALFARHGISQQIFCRSYLRQGFPSQTAAYAATTQIVRIADQRRGSFANYANFLRQVLAQASPQADAFVGYDLHGFLPARLLAARYRKPLIYHSHDYVENGSQRASLSIFLLKQFERLFARTADIVIVPDQARAEFMTRELRLKKPPLVVANCPLTPPDPAYNRLQKALRERNKQFERIVFRQGVVGRAHALEVTIRSMPLWENAGWGFVLLGPCEPAYQQELEQLAASLGVRDRFVILPPVPYDEVMQYTVGAHVGHALYEPAHINNRFITTASNKTMEYQAAGLPLLLSGSSSDLALLAKYQHGLSADVTSPESIAHAVNAMLGDEQRSQAMRQHSFSAFSQEYNYAHQYAPVLEKLQSLKMTRKRG